MIVQANLLHVKSAMSLAPCASCITPSACLLEGYVCRWLDVHKCEQRQDRWLFLGLYLAQNAVGILVSLDTYRSDDMVVLSANYVVQHTLQTPYTRQQVKHAQMHKVGR